MTPEEFANKLEAGVKIFESDFAPVLKAASDVQSEMINRIWNRSENSAKASMEKGYSTKPVYIPDSKLPRKAGSQAGKRGTPITTNFFAGGYSEMKSQVNKPPAELQGDLLRDFSRTLKVSENGRVLLTLSREENIGKLEGLEKKYGKFTDLSDDERAQYRRVLAFEFANIVNDSLA